MGDITHLHYCSKFEVDTLKGWEIDDRVCANLSIDHIYGAVNVVIANTAFGGQSRGVLTLYRIFPAHGSRFFFTQR